jgi:adenylylsulfate kinase
MSNNVKQQHYSVSREERNKANGHPSFLVLFTGLSGSGKSTLANHLERKLQQKSITTYTLDGDNLRLGLNKDLQFSQEDRKENLRRMAETGKLLVDAGVVTLAAFISPLEADRNMIRSIVGPEDYVEIYLSTSLTECERRDVKGLYLKARKGIIPDFTGISAPYETPLNPDLVLDTEHMSIENATSDILTFLTKRFPAFG